MRPLAENTIPSHTWTLSVGHNAFCLVSYRGTHPPLFALAQSPPLPPQKMADHHSNGLCSSATAVMYVVTLLTPL